MKDYLFFPLVFAAALAIIAAAALPGQNRMSCGSVSGGASLDYSSITVAGDDLCRLEVGGEARVTQIRTDDAISSVEIKASSGALGDRPDRNPHFRLAEDIERQFSGFRIRVTIEAKPGLDGGALAFEANYSAGPEGNSGWQRFNLMPDYETFSFTYDVPFKPLDAENGVDYLAIRPIVPEKDRAIEIRSVTFDRLRQIETASLNAESSS